PTRARGHQHPDDLDLGDQDLGRRRRERRRPCGQRSAQGVRRRRDRRRADRSRCVKRVDIYDTTLRDGTQGEGVNFTVRDKLAITERLDDLGVRYVEGGWPGSNPRDAEYFDSARKLRLTTARIAAFGSTARPGKAPSEDENLKMLVRAQTPVVTI